MELLWDEFVTPEDRMAPYELDWDHGIFDGNPEGNDAKGNGEVDEEGDQPVLALAKLNEAKDPPSDTAQHKVASVTVREK
jgi:hypothetical protein